jgi:hypothetical protein
MKLRDAGGPCQGKTPSLGMHVVPALLLRLCKLYNYALFPRPSSILPLSRVACAVRLTEDTIQYLLDSSTHWLCSAVMAE